MDNNNMRNILAGILTLLALNGHAAVSYQKGAIDKTLSHHAAYFGSCMIRSADFNPSNNCPAKWVSLDCSGDFHSKQGARRMWDSAQMAFALDAAVEIWVNDAKKHNGYCVVDQINVVK